MFFFFSKILTIFFFPLPLIILLGIVFTFFVQGWKNKALSFTPIALLCFFSSFPVSQKLIFDLENEYPPVSIESLPETDVIVVLGGMINPLSYYEKAELLSSADRLTDAAILWKKKKADFIIFSGGSGILFQEDATESKHAKKILISLGIPKEKIILESKSRNTFENAIYVSKILEQRKWKKVLLITSAFHMKRALGCFQKLGIDVIPYPTDYRTLQRVWNWDTFLPSIGALETSTIAIKEWLGILAYQWSGYL
ncbi:MAG: YdcF family protein, partial [Leptospiraceae bacterium]|nr:YdcF family protein [Leptospiraceae bacterium]